MKATVFASRVLGTITKPIVNITNGSSIFTANTTLATMTDGISTLSSNNNHTLSEPLILNQIFVPPGTSRYFSTTSPIFLKNIIGTSDFRELRFSDNFIDKSDIVTVFDNNGDKVCVNTFPRRFQKSANLSTLKYFYNIEVDKDGNPLPQEERKNKVLFAGGKAEDIDGNKRLLEPLKVASHPDIMRKQGNIPVISVDFKGISGGSYDKSVSKMKDAIRKAASEHAYLVNSEKVNWNSLEFKHDFEEFLAFLSDGNVTDTRLPNIIKNLSMFLETHFNKPAIILIDEYDTAINSAYRNLSTDPEDANKIIGLHREVLGEALKGNDHLYKGLVTGILRIAKANIFSGFNNSGEYSMGDRTFASLYGFTQSEIDDLINRYKVPPELGEDLKDWYNGYDVLGQPIYNPWSVLRALKSFQECSHVNDIHQIRKEVLKNYWQESGSFDFVSPLFRHPDVETTFRRLSEGNTIEFDLNKHIAVDDFMVLREMLGHPSNYEMTSHGQDILYSYLFAAGYLTPNGRAGYYRAPNKEARDEFVKKLITHYKSSYKFNNSVFNKLTDQLQLIFDSKDDNTCRKAIDGVKAAVTAIIEALPDFRKIDKNKLEPSSEVVIHGNESLIQGIISHASMQILSVTQFGSEVYVGDGRTDCIVIDDNKKKAIIFELKYNKSDANEAITQIQDRKYAKPIPDGYEVINIGLNVNCDKSIDVKYEIVLPHLVESEIGSLIDSLGNVTLRDNEAEIQAEVVGNSEGENDQIT